MGRPTDCRVPKATSACAVSVGGGPGLRAAVSSPPACEQAFSPVPLAVGTAPAMEFLLSKEPAPRETFARPENTRWEGHRASGKAPKSQARPSAAPLAPRAEWSRDRHLQCRRGHPRSLLLPAPGTSPLPWKEDCRGSVLLSPGPQRGCYSYHQCLSRPPNPPSAAQQHLAQAPAACVASLRSRAPCLPKGGACFTQAATCLWTHARGCQCL